MVAASDPGGPDLPVREVGWVVTLPAQQKEWEKLEEIMLRPGGVEGKGEEMPIAALPMLLSFVFYIYICISFDTHISSGGTGRKATRRPHYDGRAPRSFTEKCRTGIRYEEKRRTGHRCFCSGSGKYDYTHTHICLTWLAVKYLSIDHTTK